MRIKVEMEVSANDWLMMLRRLNREPANRILNASCIAPGQLPSETDNKDLLWQSAVEIIQRKK